MNQSEDDYWLSVTNDPDYTVKYFDDPTISTDETVKAIVSSFPENPRTILEIGCGYGRLTSRVKLKYPNSHVVGFDINPEIIKRAIDGPVYWAGDTFDGEWDAIYAVTVFQHLPDDKKRDYILKAGKALNPNGVLRIQFIEGERDNFVDHWVSIDKMIKWMKEAGLQVMITEKGLAHEQWVWMTGAKI